MTTDNPIEPDSLIAATIDAAEELRDPLDGLVERTTIDPGAPFAPDVLERLAALKKDDRRAFESLRAQLKEAGCRVTALDQAIAEENGGMGRRDPTQADILIDLAQSAELFYAPDGTGFADLDIARCFFEATRGAPQFGGAAIGAERDRGEGAFRCARKWGQCSHGRGGRPALPRPWRRNLARGGNRHHRLAGDRQSAGAVPPRSRDAKLADTGERRIGRDAARVP